MEINESAKELYTKIIKRLNSNYIEKEGDILSVADVSDAVVSQIEIYNCILADRNGNIVRSINKKNGYNKVLSRVNNPTPKILKMIPEVSEDGETYITIRFIDYREGVSPMRKVSRKMYDSIVESNYVDKMMPYLSNIFKNNREIFDCYFDTLKAFTIEFPGYDFAWDAGINNKYNQTIGDDFIDASISVIEPKKTTANLTRLEDMQLSMIHTKKYSELMDYIIFYSRDLLGKTPVNVNDLNPFIKELVNREYNMEDENKLIK